MSKVIVDYTLLKYAYVKIIYLCFAAFLVAVLSYNFTKKNWLASLTIENKTKIYQNDDDIKIEESYYRQFNYLFRSEVDKIAKPEFIRKVVEEIQRPDLYLSLLSHQFGGHGKIQIISQTSDTVVIYLETESKELGYKLLKAVSETIDTEYSKKVDYYIDILITLIDQTKNTIENIKKDIELLDQINTKEINDIDKINFLKLKASLRNELGKYVYKINNYNKIIQIILDKENKLIKTNIYNFVEPVWPRPKLFILIGLFLALMFNVIFMFWKKVLYLK